MRTYITPSLPPSKLFVFLFFLHCLPAFNGELQKSLEFSIGEAHAIDICGSVQFQQTARPVNSCVSQRKWDGVLAGPGLEQKGALTVHAILITGLVEGRCRSFRSLLPGRGRCVCVEPGGRAVTVGPPAWYLAAALSCPCCQVTMHHTLIHSTPLFLCLLNNPPPLHVEIDS